eukprot:7379411-Prymnesium_polylepis.3
MTHHFHIWQCGKYKTRAGKCPGHIQEAPHKHPDILATPFQHTLTHTHAHINNSTCPSTFDVSALTTHSTLTDGYAEVCPPRATPLLPGVFDGVAPRRRTQSHRQRARRRLQRRHPQCRSTSRHPILVRTRRPRRPGHCRMACASPSDVAACGGTAWWEAPAPGWRRT